MGGVSTKPAGWTCAKRLRKNNAVANTTAVHESEGYGTAFEVPALGANERLP
jgi:hypothetical protein